MESQEPVALPSLKVIEYLALNNISCDKLLLNGVEIRIACLTACRRAEYARVPSPEVEVHMMAQLKYRPHIDGIRALAVLPVVLFHADVPYFDGGFVGVDIFFVISGFLITSIIERDIASGPFSVTAFYERRIRRLAPSLIAVLLACLSLGILTLAPGELGPVDKVIDARILA